MSDLIERLERSALTQEQPTRGYILEAVARIEELEAALEHIKQHQDVVCKGNPEFSATWNIANNTLDRLPKGK